MLNEISNVLGYQISDFPLNGEIHRFPADNKNKLPLWAVGVEFEYGAKKEKIQFVNFGDWRNGEVHKWCNIDYESRSSQFKNSFNKVITKVKESVDNEKIIRNTECSEESTRLYNSTPTGDTHDYMISKGLNSNYNAKSDKNTLMIPTYSFNDEGKRYITGLQKIYKDKETLRFEKRFTSGIKKRGSFMLPIDFEIETTEYAYLCEGYSTGCTIYEATKTPTICCIDAGNMFSCIADIRQINQSIKLIICADDDFLTKLEKGKNPGIDAAYKAKKHFANIIIKIPVFKSRVNETDFNDLLILEGMETVSDQLVYDYTDFCDIEVLGHEDHKRVFFYSTQTMQTVSRTMSELTVNPLTMIAESKFWGTRYGAIDDQGKINWQIVAERIASEARKKGQFSWKDVRGAGVWKESDGRAIINLGDRIYDNGKIIDIGKFRSTFKYQSGASVNLISDGNIDIMKPMSKLRFKKENYEIIMSGWLAIAPIFNLLEWRPHIWLNGSRGSGKSTILGWLSSLVWNSKFYIDSTAAGIRQDIKSSASAIFIDEAEPDSNDGRSRIGAIVDMARQSSTHGNTKSVRGSATGESYELSINAIFMLGSISNSLEKKSDISRFFVVEMDEIKNQSMEEFNQIKQEFKSICPTSLMLRSVKMYPTILKSIEIIKHAFRDKMEPRQCDLIAPILAGHHSLYHETVITPDRAEVYLGLLDMKEQQAEMEESESDVVINDIFNILCDRQMNLTIGACIDQKKHTPLEVFGIRPIADGVIFIESLNKNITDALGRKYGKLLRLNKNYPQTTCRVNGRVRFGFKIPL